VLGFSDFGLVHLPPPAVVADVGFGGGRLLWWDDLQDADPAQIAASVRRIQTIAASLGGDAIVERCPSPVKNHLDIWGTQPSGLHIMRRLKQEFDPENVLNPGRFIGGL
jgi:glycolate oxidase FAD binding subunit